MQSLTGTDIREGTVRRPLQINFEPYAHFKRDLIELMIENLQELQQAYALSTVQHDKTFFQTAYHKSKTTVRILEDPEFLVVVEELTKPKPCAEHVLLFHRLTGEIITSLWIENEAGDKQAR